MKDDSSVSSECPNNILDSLHIQLLKDFRMYNPQGNNLFCSYMSFGQKYENELLVIGREPSYWPSEFSTEELIDKGPAEVFKTKVLHHAKFGLDSSCPLNYVTDLWGDTEKRSEYNTLYNSSLDPFWCCAKEIVMKLGICRDETNWPSYIALTYLYKIAYSSNRYLMDKPRMLQFEYCRKMFQLELTILKPKRVLFLTGMKYAQDFLELSDCTGLKDCVSPLGVFDYGSHKAQTVVSVHPKKYHRKNLVDLILKGFRDIPT